VWLNADSYLRFPTSFEGKERKVELKGEAYFEVAHNSAQPFKVSVSTPKGETSLMDVQVLGTHFNINGYEDEKVWSTTLLEGSVKVTQGLGPGVLLRKNQQVQIGLTDLIHRNVTEGNMAVGSAVDVQQVVAWKNGIFDFENEHITSIMRQIARWYDVDVVYKGAVPDRHYTGAIRRAVNLSEVIRMLEIAGGIKITIQNREVIVEAE
jgi:transmembrane sensor